MSTPFNMLGRKDPAFPTTAPEPVRDYLTLVSTNAKPEQITPPTPASLPRGGINPNHPSILRRKIEAAAAKPEPPVKAAPVKSAVPMDEPLLTTIENWREPPLPDKVHMERVPHKRGYAESSLWVTVYSDGSLGFHLDYSSSKERIVSAEDALKVLSVWRTGRGELDFHTFWFIWKDDLLSVRCVEPPLQSRTYHSDSTVITAASAKRAYQHVFAVWANVRAKTP